MKTRRAFRIFILVACLVPLWGLSGAETRELVLLHMNDTHGHVTSAGEHSPPEGGMARLATEVSRVREEAPGKVLLLHAGDILSRGEPVTVYTAGEANFRLMNRLGYDALTPGNGDYYFGVDTLLACVKVAEFPVVEANVIDTRTGKSLFEPWVIKEVNGVRIGILGIGVIREELPGAKHLRLMDPIETARQSLPALAGQCDLVVVLSHCGDELDRTLAGEVQGIDIIVGGHSHTLMDPPEVLTGPGGATVYVGQAGDYGRWLGRMDVTVNLGSEGPHVAALQGRLIPLTRAVAKDSAIDALLAQYKAPLKEVLCQSTVRLEFSELRPSPAGRFVADALRQATEADIALLDTGAVCAAIKPGAITVQDVCLIHPWRNGVLLFEAPGRRIADAIAETSLVMAGGTFRKTGRNVTDIQVAGAPIDMEKTYTVAMSDFGFGMTKALAGVEYRDSGLRVDKVLEKAFRDAGTIGKEAEKQYGHP